jgi:hypothetical protein
MDYARKIVAQAVVRKAEALTAAQVDQIGAQVQPEFPEQRDYMVLEACKEHISDHIIAMAQHGAFGLPGPEALLRFLGVEVAGSESIAEPPLKASSGSPRSPASPSSRRTVTDQDRRIVLATPSKDELKRALKYAASSGVGLSVKLTSAHPLGLELVPGAGFEKRFADLVRGPSRADDTRAAANALVFRTLIDVVANADIAGLHAWLPSIDVGLILDPSLCGVVLVAYQAELFRRTREVIESTGHLGLSTFPDVAYVGADAFNI